MEAVQTFISQMIAQHNMTLANDSFVSRELETLERRLNFLDKHVRLTGPEYIDAIAKVWYPENLQRYKMLVKQNKFDILSLPQLYRHAIEHYELVCKQYNIK